MGLTVTSQCEIPNGTGELLVEDYFTLYWYMH